MKRGHTLCGFSRTSGIFLQWVPEPAKEHLKYVELEPLKKDSMMHRTLQVLWSSALHLSCVRKQLLLLSEGEDLKIEQQRKPDPGAIYVRGDYKALIRAHPERIGEWLGRTLTHCLFNQGPYCAALLLKVRFASGNRYVLLDIEHETSSCSSRNIHPAGPLHGAEQITGN